MKLAYISYKKKVIGWYMQDSHALLSVIRCTEFLIKNHVMERLGILWDCKKDLNQTL